MRRCEALSGHRLNCSDYHLPTRRAGLACTTRKGAPASRTIVASPPRAFSRLRDRPSFLPWSASVTSPLSPSPDTILHDVFGYSAFRGAQAEIVDHVIAGGDALVLMPTGGGKSLC